MGEIREKGIKSWSPEDRPREKLKYKGPRALSNSELIAILLRSGTRTKTAVELAQELLKNNRDDLDKLGKSSLSSFKKIKGVGEAKAITLLAALELGKRRKAHLPNEKPLISSSRDAFDFLQPIFNDLQHEQFYLLLLNRSNHVVFHRRISDGGVGATVVDPKILFKVAIDELASSIIIAHNHPSGNLKPSQADISLTNKINEAGKFLDIKLLDHLIVTDSSYFSFADEGLIS